MTDNCVSLVGFLTRDPELKFVGQNNTALATFGLGITEKLGGNKTKPHFFEIKCWGAVAEAAASELRKGSAAVVVGRLDFEQWEKDGRKQNRICVRGETIGLPLWKKAEPAAPAADPAAPKTADNDDVPF